MAHRDRNAEQKESDNYWNSGVHGNKEDYEAYLLIKNQLEGRRPPMPSRRGARISVLSFSPFLWLGFAGALFINATEIVQACMQRESTISFIVDILYWSVASVVIYWYFKKFTPLEEPMRFFDVSVPHSWPSWAFLGGWILANLNSSDFNVWVLGIMKFSSLLGTSLSWNGDLFSGLPGTPALLKFLGGLAATLGGVLLAYDVVAAYQERAE
jgi:hypothetical protein